MSISFSMLKVLAAVPVWVAGWCSLAAVTLSSLLGILPWLISFPVLLGRLSILCSPKHQEQRL